MTSNACPPTPRLLPRPTRRNSSRARSGTRRAASSTRATACYRALSADGLSDFQALEATGAWERFSESGSLVATELLDGTAGLPAGLVKDSAGVLKHERIPFVSYPYEWPFSMLKDAALLQLDLILAALEEDMILKDSTPYNVQFKGAQPVFVDVGSFERLREGEPWVGYRQFCMLYLYPLLLQSVKDVAPQPLLRGAIDGITPAQMRGMVSFRDRFRKGFYLNVFLHAKLEQRHGDRGKEVKDEVKKAGFKKELIQANVKQDAQAGRGARMEPAAGRLGRIRRAQQLHRRRRQAQGRVRARGGRLAAVGPHLGHRREQRPLLAHRRGGLPLRARRRRRPGARSSCSTAPCATRATRRSSPSR